MNTIKALTLLVLMTNASLAITYRGDVSKAKYQEYGSKHSCVVRICATVRDTKYNTCASGVVISPHIVVTAAHVMADVEDSRVVIGTKSYPIKAAVCPSSYAQKKYGFGDIAVCYVDKEIPQKFYVQLYENKDEVGKVCSISGWGRSGSFTSGHQSHSTKIRLAGSNIIEGTDRDMLMVSPSRLTSKTNTTLECIVSPGDSGGGMFVDGKLAGIHSVITTTVKNNGSKNMLNGGYHCHSGSTRISVYKDWIIKTADQLTNFYKLTREINKVLLYTE